MGQEFSHFDHQGRGKMVDISAKEITNRVAQARGTIKMQMETLELISQGKLTKGDVLAVAQVAAVMAVKEASRLIPLAHTLPISGVEVDFNLQAKTGEIEVCVTVKTTGQTGVEMEALTGVSVALLTIYDMAKAVDKQMVLDNIRLVEKWGGRSGHYWREGERQWDK